jgi:single-stranded-DNA-specific exonuclease
MAEAWRLRPVDENCVRTLASRLGLRGLTARILTARGFSSVEKTSQFLNPRLAHLRPPSGMADLDRAIDRILWALRHDEKIAVFGDYDVDGITSTAILVQMLRGLGAKVIARMAIRASGYGFSEGDARRFVEQACSLVLTVDCGTSDFDSLSYCRSHGVDVIVIDHHHVPSGESAAFALLNSHRQDDFFAFKGLASCGVAFYLAAAVRSKLRAEGDVRSDCLEPRSWLDFVALGTIADLVPLTDENRILVAAGLRELSSLRRPGLSALVEVSGLQNTTVDTVDISFRLAPRLNAAGRLGDAQLALELLLAEDRSSAQDLATKLDDLNRERQRIQERIWMEAMEAAAQYPDDPALVLGAEGWHQGVVGIVAAKLVEKYRKPSVVIGFQDGHGRGSARTCGGFDLYRGLSSCRQHLTTFGGHSMAAGVSLSKGNLEFFRRDFCSVAREHFLSCRSETSIEVDAIANLADLDIFQAEELERLAPFGSANVEPMIVVPGVITRNTRVVGMSHLQMTLAHGATVSESIAFGLGNLDPGTGARLDVIGTVETDSYRGQRRIRLRLRHLMRSVT